MITSKINNFLLLALASTLAFAGAALIGFSLAFDSWRETSRNMTFGGTKQFQVLVTQGIRHECYKNKSKPIQPNKCHPWYKSKDVKELLNYHELLIYLIAQSSITVAISLVFSLVATTSRVPKCCTQVIALELAAVTTGLMALIIYTVHYIHNPWSVSYSYFCLWIGVIFVIVSMIIHTYLGDVKFFGKKCFVQPAPVYRYHKGNTTIELVGNGT